MRLPISARLMPEAPTLPWKPFVVASLCFTLTIGALTGAIDLWNLRVVMKAVPLDHHRAHAFAQLFGFLGLFTMGVSLHLAPRFFGAAPATLARRGVMAWSGIGGVVLVIAGRLGGLLPFSEVFSVAGAVLVLVAMTAWAGLLLKFWRSRPGVGDALHRFLLAGVLWWWLAAVALLAWTLGQVFGGSLLGVPVESIWALGLFGGTASWLWGIFLRAGICTLRVKAPAEVAQRRLFVVWQLAALFAALAPWFDATWINAVQPLSAAVAVGMVWWTLRPFSGTALEATMPPRAVQAGLVFLSIFALLSVWRALGALGLWAPALLGDATRHAFTLGGVTLMVLGFAGRMVPGFSGKTLRWKAGYDAGVLAVMIAAALRLAELVSSRLGFALAGASGGLAFLGLALVSTSLLGTILPVPASQAGVAREAA